MTVVGSGTEAWEKLHEKGANFDLVLTDVMMPAISGFNLLQMINEDKTLRQIPVICMFFLFALLYLIITFFGDHSDPLIFGLHNFTRKTVFRVAIIILIFPN